MQSIPRQLRHEVFVRDGYRCKECGASVEDGATLEIDHIVPVAKGGTNDIDNLQTLCKECNRAKYTDEWVAGVSTEELLNNELSKLIDEYEKAEKNLSLATSEEDKFNYKYDLVKLAERISEIQSKLQDINYENDLGVSKAKDKYYKQKDLLFKMLLFNLDKYSFNMLNSRFGLSGETTEDCLKDLVNKYTAYEIKCVLEKESIIIRNNYHRERANKYGIELFKADELIPFMRKPSEEITFKIFNDCYWSREAREFEINLEKILNEASCRELSNYLKHAGFTIFGSYSTPCSLKKFLSDNGYYYCPKCGKRVETEGLCADCKNPKQFINLDTPKIEIKYISCPNCGKRIQSNALRCKHCKTMLKK